MWKKFITHKKGMFLNVLVTVGGARWQAISDNQGCLLMACQRESL